MNLMKFLVEFRNFSLFPLNFSVTKKPSNNIGGMWTYNADHGYCDGILRGYKSGILSNAVYNNLTQCETLEGNSRKFRIDISS